MKAILTRLFYDRRGATAIEYGLICAMIVLAMLTALRGVADQNTGIWAVFSTKTTEAIAAANGG